MIKKLGITILLSLCTMILFAQNQEVISTTGKYFENSAGSVSYTIGECLIYSFISSNLTLTQGFQQHLYIISDFPEIKGSNFKIIAYPNPVKDYVILSVESNPGLNYIIYDMSGVIIERKEIIGSESEISFENLNPSVYVLKVFNNKIEVKAFKIIKY